MISPLPFAVLLLLTAVTSIAGQCDLFSYQKSRFMNSARVHKDFIGGMEKINTFASDCEVMVYVTSSFRKSGQVIGGAIVKPARRSNHYVGHAIDMNLQAKNGAWCNSRCLGSVPISYPSVKCFIQKIKDDSDLRWGGDFSVTDVVHIDDGLNMIRKPNDYNRLYNLLQKNCS